MTDSKDYNSCTTEQVFYYKVISKKSITHAFVILCRLHTAKNLNVNLKNVQCYFCSISVNKSAVKYVGMCVCDFEIVNQQDLLLLGHESLQLM